MGVDAGSPVLAEAIAVDEGHLDAYFSSAKDTGTKTVSLTADARPTAFSSAETQDAGQSGAQKKRSSIFKGLTGRKKSSGSLEEALDGQPSSPEGAGDARREVALDASDGSAKKKKGGLLERFKRDKSANSLADANGPVNEPMERELVEYVTEDGTVVSEEAPVAAAPKRGGLFKRSQSKPSLAEGADTPFANNSGTGIAAGAPLEDAAKPMSRSSSLKKLTKSLTKRLSANKLSAMDAAAPPQDAPDADASAAAASGGLMARARSLTNLRAFGKKDDGDKDSLGSKEDAIKTEALPSDSAEDLSASKPPSSAGDEPHAAAPVAAAGAGSTSDAGAVDAPGSSASSARDLSHAHAGTYSSAVGLSEITAAADDEAESTAAAAAAAAAVSRQASAPDEVPEFAPTEHEDPTLRAKTSAAEGRGGLLGFLRRKPLPPAEVLQAEGAGKAADDTDTVAAKVATAVDASPQGSARAAGAAAGASAFTAALAVTPEPEKEPPIRKFPRGFMWGSATSAHQVEGAYQDEGKGLTIWDAFSHSPGKITNGANADVTCCHFYRYKEDVALMRTMGLRYYRLSISWARLFPNGKGKVNERGVAFYDRLINELVANKIMPVVTLYHWDLPLSLQMEEDGWLSPRIVDHFVKFAKLCFSRFGDRVKYWITFNEPWCSAVLGHDSGGQHAPGRTMDPSREVYKVGHHMLLAHAKAYQVYNKLFKRKQRGKVGVALNGDWYEAKPAADPEEQRRNERAAERALEFTVGWFARPLYQGDYPTVMRERVGNRLPRFTAEQQRMLKGSADFFGLNHYSSHLCEQPTWYKELTPAEDDDASRNKLERVRQQLNQALARVPGFGTREDAATDGGDVPDGESPGGSGKVQLLAEDEAPPEDPYIESTGFWQDISVDQSDDDCWKTTDMGWGVHPEGLRKMLNYIQTEYNPKGGIVITENGVAVREDDVDSALKDIERAVYLKRYLTEVHKALVNDDVDVRGYFVWSLLDNFEWGYGYTKKFGMHYVDMQTLERVPKMSAHWYSEVIKKNRLDLV